MGHPVLEEVSLSRNLSNKEILFMSISQVNFALKFFTIFEYYVDAFLYRLFTYLPRTQNPSQIRQRQKQCHFLDFVRQRDLNPQIQKHKFKTSN